MPKGETHTKTAATKRAEIAELDREMAKPYFCGSCGIGLNSIEEFVAHNTEEEHNYHIARRLESMVPGLGFCPACSILLQTKKGWDAHACTPKHLNCIKSLNAIGIFGEYSQPLGCTAPGEIGLPIDSSEIDQKVSNSYGYGHGGRIGKGVAIIGLNYVKQTSGFTYRCEFCKVDFTFELRANHMAGKPHRLKYLAEFYPELWLETRKICPDTMKMQLTFKLMYLAHKVEQMELEKETATSIELRDRFCNTITMRKDHNVGLEREKRPDRRIKTHIGFVKATRDTKEGEKYRGERPLRDSYVRKKPDSKSSRGGRGKNPKPQSSRGDKTSRVSFPSTTPQRQRIIQRQKLMATAPKPFMTTPEPRPSFEGGYCGDLLPESALGKRPTKLVGYPPINHVSKKLKPDHDPYEEIAAINQLDQAKVDTNEDPYEEKPSVAMSDALEALKVLEDYSGSKPPAPAREPSIQGPVKHFIGNHSSEPTILPTTPRGRGMPRSRGPRSSHHPRDGGPPITHLPIGGGPPITHHPRGAGPPPVSHHGVELFEDYDPRSDPYVRGPGPPPYEPHGMEYEDYGPRPDPYTRGRGRGRGRGPPLHEPYDEGYETFPPGPDPFVRGRGRPTPHGHYDMGYDVGYEDEAPGYRGSRARGRSSFSHRGHPGHPPPPRSTLPAFATRGGRGNMRAKMLMKFK